MKTANQTNQDTASLDQTEALLNALIVECHSIIREEVLPIMRSPQKWDDRYNCMSVINTLIKTSTEVADSITRLRGAGAVAENRQRIVVERVQTLPAPHAVPLLAKEEDQEGEGV